MSSQQMQSMIGCLVMILTPAIAWCGYQLFGDDISGPNKYLWPLLAAAAFLVVAWTATWWRSLPAGRGRYVATGLSLMGAAVAGVVTGFVVMGLEAHPLTGMISIFAVAGPTWVLATSFTWSRLRHGQPRSG